MPNTIEDTLLENELSPTLWYSAHDVLYARLTKETLNAKTTQELQFCFGILSLVSQGSVKLTEGVCGEILYSANLLN